MNQYAIYLRKSRADMEAEARGEGETLSRHKEKLLEIAKSQRLPVTCIYKEIVSGETIEARPEMQKLLKAVNDGKFSGVLCMEIERLARGDSIDQGIVARAFKFSNTKIITPVKTYDPSNEFDEEYFEFSLFMSRREYKTINRRMQAGRIASVKEGNYIGTYAPYGYKKVHDYEQRRFTLEPIPEEADTVRLIYDLYINHDMGYSKIATHLNNLGIAPKRIDTWGMASVKAIIENPLYYGKIRWNWRKSKKVIVDGVVKKINPINDDYDVFDGCHQPLVSEEIWRQAESIRNKNTHTRTQSKRELKNQFAGLAYCKLCGRAMVRRPYTTGEVFFMCNHNGCKCVSSKFEDVDNAVYNAIIKTYREKLQPSPEQKVDTTSYEMLEKKISKELEKIKSQQNKLYDLLEQGIYTPEIFVERSEVLNKKQSELSKQLEELRKNKLPDIAPQEVILKLRHVIDSYYQCMNATEKNKLLKSVISRIDYIKTQRCGDFEVFLSFIF